MYDLLSGIRIVEMGHIALGPLAAQMRGDYGADVMKVESLSGDLYRANGVSRNLAMSAQRMACNCNKRSIAIDLISGGKQRAARAGADGGLRCLTNWIFRTAACRTSSHC
jgi:crotonobetainyl-CoA:carnitine CoA-transferase CaiB-like acyl-CoA transferase